MSAWYLFNAMGFYPVCPGSNHYAFGSPALKKVVISLTGNKSFSISAENLTEQNIYIQKVTLNGKAWNSPYFSYDELKSGGELIFTMGPKPNKKWGTQVNLTELNALNGQK
jgi:putative alpha-1,2-mannosidase